MISGLAALFKGNKNQSIRIYVNGVEIDKIEPRLPFLDLDDWMTPFLKYVFEERSDWGNEFYMRTAKDPNRDAKAPITGIWFGPVPAQEKKKGGYWSVATYNGKKPESEAHDEKSLP